MRRNCDRGIELAERRRRERQAGDDAWLARRQDRARACSLRHGGDRGDVAGAAEVFVERAFDGGFNDERREKGIGAEEGGGHD